MGSKVTRAVHDNTGIDDHQQRENTPQVSRSNQGGSSPETRVLKNNKEGGRIPRLGEAVLQRVDQDKEWRVPERGYTSQGSERKQARGPKKCMKTQGTKTQICEKRK